MSVPVADLTSRRLRARLAHWQVEGRLPSIVAGLVRDGDLVWCDGYGDVPGDPSDVQYKIGSITKTVTAVLVHQLAGEGLLDLDAPVSAVLGEVGHGDRTSRQLLTHSSGMQAEPTGDWWERAGRGSFPELAEANDGSSPAFGVGERHHYSNLAYAVLGEVVARLRGATWWDCVDRRVLRPLGMDRTTYHPEEPHADGFSVHPFTGALLPEPNPDTGAMAPAGQLWSTITDLARWCRFLLQGHPDVLPRPALEAAYTPGPGDSATGLGAGQALGFQLARGGSGTLVGHSGSMPGFVATCFVDRIRRTGAMALCNATAGMAAAVVAAGLLDELELSEPTVLPPWQPSSPVPAELHDVLGVWHWGATTLVLAWEGSTLVTRRGGLEIYRHVVRDGRIVGVSGHQAGEELRVVRRDDGTVSHLDLATFVLTRTPYDPSAPIPGGPPVEG